MRNKRFLKEENKMEEKNVNTTGTENKDELTTVKDSKFKKALNGALAFGKKALVPTLTFFAGFVLGKISGTDTVAEAATEVVETISENV